MGIDVPSTQFLCCAKRMKVDFSTTLTVGRQRVNAPLNTIISILGGIDIPREQVSSIEDYEYAEPLFYPLRR
jgi:hypothetical protein